MDQPIVNVNQKYLDFLESGLTKVERACVQNLEVPLSVDEVRQQFPILPGIIRIISGYALIWSGSGKILVADLSALLGARTADLFCGYGHGDHQMVVEIKQLLDSIEAHIYGAAVPA